MLNKSFYGIKPVWDRYLDDQLRHERITFNLNNPIYIDYYLPIGSKMLIYVLGKVQRLIGVSEVTSDYRNSGDPRFNTEVSVKSLCEKTTGLTPIEIRKHLKTFNPHQEGISYIPIKQSIFNQLYIDLQKKL
ncbi:hypothetical protein [Bacillus sp. REN3]|uniref:hypothetical protein n=1 Tax=Bacillus sp. REN3 TaxID=2802440 RepID=UPI001AEF0E41|nr:hypothetical protein [Bacillus sp. REN3]